MMNKIKAEEKLELSGNSENMNGPASERKKETGIYS